MEDSIAKGKLPYPPSINKYWQTRQIKSRITGKIIKSVHRTAEVQRYVATASFLIKHQKIKPTTGRKLHLSLHIYPPDERKRDLDNVCKAICDTLQHAGIYDDDYKIWVLHVERKTVRKGGEVEFFIKEIE